MKKNGWLVSLSVLTVCWMLIIYGFSSQTGEESGGASGFISMPLTRLVMRFMDASASEDAVYLRVDHAVRKAAHFTEYAILGGLLTLLCSCIRVRNNVLPPLIGVIFAMTDEWHQSFTPGRASAWLDVLIDACGMAVGVCICSCIIKYWRKKHVYDS